MKLIPLCFLILWQSLKEVVSKSSIFNSFLMHPLQSSKSKNNPVGSKSRRLLKQDKINDSLLDGRGNEWKEGTYLGFALNHLWVKLLRWITCRFPNSISWTVSKFRLNSYCYFFLILYSLWKKKASPLILLLLYFYSVWKKPTPLLSLLLHFCIPIHLWILLLSCQLIQSVTSSTWSHWFFLLQRTYGPSGNLFFHSKLRLKMN